MDEILSQQYKNNIIKVELIFTTHLFEMFVVHSLQQNFLLMQQFWNWKIYLCISTERVPLQYTNRDVQILL